LPKTTARHPIGSDYSPSSNAKIPGVAQRANRAPLLIGKIVFVHKKPGYTSYTRLLDGTFTILSALWAVGLAKGIQRQYGPRRTSLGIESGVFVVGLCAHSFLQTLLYTIVLNHNYKGESMVCGWTEMPAVLFWEYLDHIHYVFVLVMVNLRDLERLPSTRILWPCG
jgi:hypothetical protein